jgi:RNA polymerase sigma factor (sigma-70 family)
MAPVPLQTVLRHIRQLANRPGGGTTDADLLERFVAGHDEAAFELLMWRHGPMVLGVCRRVLRHEQDAEDAFQATFLMLVRKAATVSKRQSLGSWLYKVAFRVALAAKDRSGLPLLNGHADHVPAPDAASDLVWRDFRPVLDEEIDRLPEKYRAPFVLCYLEGKTNEEAAQQLGCPRGTVQSRLARARERIRSRLTRRGIALSTGLLTVALSEKAAPATVSLALVHATIKAAAPVAAGTLTSVAASAEVAALVQGVSRAMFWTKVKMTIVLVAMLGLAGSGAVLLAGGVRGSALKPDEASQPEITGQVTSPSAALNDAAQPTPAPGQVADPARVAKDRAVSRDNLKRIALAMVNYESAYGFFPPPAIYSGSDAAQQGGMKGMMGMMQSQMMGNTMRGRMGGGPMGRKFGGGPMGGKMMEGAQDNHLPGKAFLSWRVMLLPYLNENELYQKFKLDEPWDSPHNIQLLGSMPKVYDLPYMCTWNVTTQTYYQVFVGPGAAFEKHQAMRIADITDGTSNTILIIEARTPVPWTKPEDLAYDPDEPLPELGNPGSDGIQAALADGSVQTLKRNISESMLRALITRNGGEVIDSSLAFEPGRVVTPELPHVDRGTLQNEHTKLQAELKKTQDAIAQLKTELKAAREAARVDEEAQRLQKENAVLRDQLEQARQEAESLAEQLQRLKTGIREKHPRH